MSVEHYIKTMDKKVKTMFIENNRLLKSYYIKEMKNKKKDLNISISIRSVSKKDIEHINNIFHKE
ncbi:endonuclease containing a URI domain [Brachyspira intermedia PWS/A]|uniref:Endonuclease containing a URI domain n=1 Tax=Brachyspira intermedia (strain ATCC 51140 / PWS/A) TaxID=1045858 RepID=G0EK60_BRAIP|nr:endonuclease containing a URI domain [Brachyspira intermedia PWS/A]